MKKIVLFLSLIVAFGCKNAKKETEIKNETKNMTFYVGTYTKKDSKGIYKYAISPEGKLSKIGLMAEVINPSFLTKSKDNKTLFAVGETDINGTGFISAFKIEKDTLQLINKAETGGANPCFVAINNDNYIVTANYSGGNVGLLKADNSGKLAPLLFVQQHSGKGTTKRQESPHAHSAWFHPNKEKIISVDLGTNELWFSKIDTNKNELVFTNQKTLKMADGAGPRHLTFHPNNKWIYVLNELNNTVSLVKEKNDVYFVDSSITTLPNDFTDFSKAADIHISDDGKFVYASNRGHNSIAIFKVNSENGNLEITGYEDVLGDHPRNFSLSPDNDFLIVANQDTNNIISFKRNTTTGKLTFVDEVFAPTPVCILF
ncbi:lactonase family protein [Polaribacter aestuariivivens]|uniref:Lactonase family protein n=1 Tax=Polaribacter aestuariivivens TaxID=2304626 RepID=A0A5S3NA07_9FLAO|nr:lactonase family protein [Polaribacter aestuariivivens]TMM32023.1 lactonase family protein [Polaribacter aestuariivivens]